MTSYEIGLAAERRAAEWLESRGYRVLKRRYRVYGGELDIVAEKEGTLVFCEVKQRKSTAYGAPFEALTPQKKRNLTRAAGAYLAETCGWDGPIRFDLIEIVGAAMTDVRHYENAFCPGGWL